VRFPSGWMNDVHFPVKGHSEDFKYGTDPGYREIQDNTQK